MEMAQCCLLCDVTLASLSLVMESTLKLHVEFQRQVTFCQGSVVALVTSTMRVA